MKKFVLGMIGLSLSASIYASASSEIPANYVPAINQTQDKEKVVKQYVPVPMPGQLMPASKRALVAHYDTKHLTGIAAVKAANERSEQQPSSSQYINSIMTYYYMPGALYQIYAAPLNITDLELQGGEQIVSVGAGDTLRWEVSRTFSGTGNERHEHLLIKPVEEGLTNSLVVTTNFRTYHLELHSTSNTYMASVTWRYPSQNASNETSGTVQTFSNQAEAGEGPKSTIPNLTLGNLDFNYEANIFSEKTPTWVPIMVFSNGEKTFLQFPSHMQVAPALFIGEPNNERMVNYRVEGNYYIVDQVVRSLILRVGQTDPVIVQIIHR
jgi:type IV secretion system protein VirB9